MPIVLAAAAVLALMAGAGTGIVVWLVTRSNGDATPRQSVSSVEVKGLIVLKRGQFVWDSTSCEGLSGFDDLREGASVTVTDASGKVLAVGSLSKGTAQGITTEGGLDRATTCEIPFFVSGVPAGVGPYGIEVSHRGVEHFNEDQLGDVKLGL